MCLFNQLFNVVLMLPIYAIVEPSKNLFTYLTFTKMIICNVRVKNCNLVATKVDYKCNVLNTCNILIKLLHMSKRHTAILQPGIVFL